MQGLSSAELLSGQGAPGSLFPQSRAVPQDPVGSLWLQQGPKSFPEQQPPLPGPLVPGPSQWGSPGAAGLGSPRCHPVVSPMAQEQRRGVLPMAACSMPAPCLLPVPASGSMPCTWAQIHLETQTTEEAAKPPRAWAPRFRHSRDFPGPGVFLFKIKMVFLKQIKTRLKATVNICDLTAKAFLPLSEIAPFPL